MPARDNIIKAFWLLHREKNLDKITVKDLMDKAGYHRSLFYVHFKDIYDLYAKEQTQFFAELNELLPQIVETFMLSNHDTAKLKISTAFFQKYGEKVAIMLGEHGDMAFQFKLKEIIRQNLYTLLNLPQDDYQTKLAIEFFVNGHINAIVYFYHHQQNLMITDYWKMIRKVLLTIFERSKN